MTILRKKADRAKETPPPRYLYQKKPRFLAQVADSLKDAAVGELKSLGAGDISPSFRGIYFTAGAETLYRVNYMSRLISRVLAPLVRFDCHNTDSLYKSARQVGWTEFFDGESSFDVFAGTAESRVANGKVAALRVKDAIVDHFLENAGVRPKAVPVNPDVDIHLYIVKNVATLFLDVSGGALHRRGYREGSVSSSLGETAAAGIIRMTGWNGRVALYDPMCGSGTLLCEALMYYCRIPAGIFRKRFGFEHLPDFEPEKWKRVKAEADGGIRALPQGLIGGSDISEKALRAARTNLMGLHYGGYVDVRNSDFRDLPDLKNRVIVTHPPYGPPAGKEKAGKEADTDSIYRDLGRFLKKKCSRSDAYIYFRDPSCIGKVGLKPAWKKPLQSGGVDGRLVKYRL